MNRFLSQVTPATPEGQRLQHLISVYCLAFLAFVIIKVFTGDDSLVIDLLAAALLFFTNQSMNYTFLAWFVLLTFSSILKMICTIGLHVQTGVSMFGEGYLFRTIVYLVGFGVYGVGSGGLLRLLSGVQCLQRV